MSEDKLKRAIEVRQRLRDDFLFYAPHALKIRTKDAKIIPLEPNAAQRLFMEKVEETWRKTGRVRAIILKGRQQGLSTVIGGLAYWRVSQTPANKAMVLAHVAESSKALFDMAHRYHEQCPEALKPSTKYASRRELKFDKLDSAYIVATAGGDSVARGETLTFVHASEVAFWPKNTARDIWNGLYAAVPDVSGTMVFIESTANGIGNLFHEQWTQAVEGKSEFIPIFIPWFLQPEYRSPVRPDFERTEQEEQLAAKFGLDDEQLQWRRFKIASTSSDQFRQEYPCTPEEAFIASGMPVFNPDQIHGMLSSNLPDAEMMTLDALEGFTPHPRGDLAVWHKPKAGETYTIGADVAEGIKGGDYSVAQVLDSKKCLVARYLAHIHPDAFAVLLDKLGRWYNDALIAVERNNHGLLTLNDLHKRLEYPNTYYEMVEDRGADEDTQRIGFLMSAKTKPLVIDRLRGDMRRGAITIYDRTTLRELLTYVMDESGRYTAPKGLHDDCVTSLAIANHCWQEPFTAITNSDEWFVSGI